MHDPTDTHTDIHLQRVRDVHADVQCGKRKGITEGRTDRAKRTRRERAQIQMTMIIVTPVRVCVCISIVAARRQHCRPH